MSLRVWLPLTKDLRNQGLDNVTVTTANTNVFQNEGKLGGKSLDVSGHYAFRVPSLVKKRVFSCSFWYKPITDSSLSDNWRRIIVFDTYTSDGSTVGAIFRFESSYGYQSSSTSYCISIHNNTGEPIALIGAGLGATDGWNKWQHITITADGTILRCYRDGVQVASGAMSNGGMLQGTVHIGYSGNRPIGRLNDFRIYDHCLSLMEIKELSKGLVLHYPLNRGGWGQENLHKNSDTITSTWTINQGTVSDGVVTITPTTSSDRRIYQMPANGGWSWQSGQTYTASIDAKSPNNAVLIIYPYGAGSMSQSYTITPEWKRYSFTFTATQSGTSSMTYHVSQTSGVSLQLKHPKLELGSIATPWCPNSSDALATTMGLNGTTEYDCSGFCNNGTRTGTFEWTSDTPKYSVSTIFNASHPDYIKIPYTSHAVQGAKEMTWSIWAYDDDWSTYSGRIYSCTEGGGVNIEDGDSTLNWAVNMYTAADYSTYAYQGYCSVNKAVLSSGWHMFTWVYTTTGTKVYVDGVLKSTVNINSYGIHFANTALYLGAEAQGETTSTGYYLTGKLSDFRIYATALSADDVKSLYQNSAYIDSDGNVYGAVHSEV